MGLAGAAVRGLARRGSDARLERIFGSGPGLRMLFGRARRAYVPGAAPAGVAGEIEFRLPSPRDPGRCWVIAVDAAAATPRPGRAEANPLLTLTLSVPNLVRIATGDLDAGRALLDGRLDLAGDMAVAERLGPMFGRTRLL